jgi:hypothetical protein
VPRGFLTALRADVFSSAQIGLETALLAGRLHGRMECRQRLWMSMSGSSSIRRLKWCAVIVGLHELFPVGRRATAGRDGRRFERFAEVRERITSRGRSHPGLLPLANLRFEVSRLLPAVSSEPDVANTPRALQWKLLGYPAAG